MVGVICKAILHARRELTEKADRYWPLCCTFVNAVKVLAVDKD